MGVKHAYTATGANDGATGNLATIAVGGTAIARLFKADGTTMVIEGLTVGTAGPNILIDNVTIAVSDIVATTSGTILEGNV